MPLIYEPSLVLLSLLIAIQGSYVALRIALQVRRSHGQTRRLLLAGAACSLAVGIWGMHFIGMLAARLPVPVNYLVLPTLLSFLICVLVVGVALEAVSLWPRTYYTLAAAPVAVGIGIVAMHYTGMWALHVSTRMVNNPLMVAGSVLISIAASGMALWLTFDDARRPSLFVSALFLGLAISGMHYTAMAGTVFYPLANAAPPSSPAVSPDLLAIIVAIVAFTLSGVFLLTFVPEQSSQGQKPSEGLPSPVTSGISRELAGGRDAMPELSAEPAIVLPGSEPAPRLVAVQSLPIERDGLKTSIKTDHIFAVRADAHYTFVFDGGEDLFCPLAIGEVEEQLAGGNFLRVHRSHIVNLDRVRSVRRAGDNAVAELTSLLPKTVPVSRAKFNELRVLVQERAYAGPK